MKCPRCGKNKASEDAEYGVLPCNNCQNEDSTIPKPTQGVTYDFASPSTKNQRKEYGGEMYKPYVNGVLSREYVESWGTDKLYGVTKKDIKKSKYVYGNMTRAHKTLENAKNKSREIYGDKPKNDYRVEGL